MPRLPLAALLLTAAAAPAADTPEQTKFFETKVRPVLIEHCYKCHAADAEKVRGNLTLDTRDGVRTGGDNGPAVVPGDPTKGTLLKALRSKEEGVAMPPKGPLPAQVIADIEAWVKMGAPDPRDGAAAHAPKREIDIHKGREFWAFQPPKPTAPPVAGSWATTDVDRFLLAGMQAKGLKPVADADPYTLVRRVYLDLIGLPPTPDETLAFVNDKSADRLPKLIDKLLASPHYGERWGRHWLDVARFAESTGKAVNFNYPHAWRYRDYVIAAYNADKPFDRFVTEQLAGDLMPAKDAAEKAEHTIATGFLAVGPKLLNERKPLQYELDLADEQIDTFSQAFLGVTAACARCHDHKFDPIPQSDYYALAGIFRSTETCYGTIRAIQGQHPSPLIPLPKEANPPAGTAPLSASERARLEKQLKGLKDELAEMTKKDGVMNSFLTAGGVRVRIQQAMLEAKIDLYEKDGTPKALAMGVREKYRSANSPLYARGEPDKPGKVVPRGVLQVVSTKQPAIKTGSGRKELAEWVASRDNPLTARVYVNRVWQHLFGRGLVPTPDNFGANGLPPSNPALLDHLAVWFMDHGWSTKALVRHLMTTHAYRLASANDARNYDADPDNALVWRMSPGRLDAEVIRDQLLAVGATLNRTPPKGSPVAGAGEGYSQARLRPGPFGGPREDETRRSVYLPIVRDQMPESLALFDAADPNLVTGSRENTTVPAQSLFLMNNPFVLKQAEGFAAELAKVKGTDADRVRRAYLTAFGRPATDEEVQSAESFLAKYKGKKSTRETWSAFCQAMVSSADFLMRN